MHVVRQPLLWVVTFAFMASAIPGWCADSVTRKGGGRVAGTITGSTKTELSIKPSVGEPQNIPTNEIGIIDWDDATADFKLGISDENGGRLDSAMQRVKKSKTDTQTSNAVLKKEFDFVEARILARMALADASKLDAAITALDAFRKSASDHFRYYDAVSWLGQMQLKKGDFTAAQTTFDLLGQAPWSDYKLAGKIATGRIQMLQGNADAATQAFELAIASAGNTPAEQARKYEAMLGKARSLITQSKHDQALQTLDEVTAKAPADDTSLQAEAYVLQGNALEATNRNKEAVLAYLHVDILFPKESGYHAEALYHMAKLWKTVQLPERGLEAEAKLTSAYPNSEWAKKLGATP